MRVVRTVCILALLVNAIPLAADSPETAPVAPPSTQEHTIPAYRLGFGDVIEVKFFNNERFNETVTVRPDGRISLQRMGEVYVSGLTPMELDSMITRRYSQFMQDPDITVFVREFSGYQIYVLGEVNAPGGYPIQRNMTVLQAITTAAGPNNYAKLASVVLIRREETGEISAETLNLKDVVKKNEDAFGNDVYVEPFDIVYVPKTFIGNASVWLTQLYDSTLPPVDVYLRALLYQRDLR